MLKFFQAGGLSPVRHTRQARGPRESGSSVAPCERERERERERVRERERELY
jgi:hypothetical protein